MSTTYTPQNIQGEWIQFGVAAFIFVTCMWIFRAQNSAVVFVYDTREVKG
jgi:hypothetical protein